MLTIKSSRAAPSPKDTIKPGGIQTLFEWKRKSNTRQQTTAAPLVKENVCRHTKPTEEPALELTNTISRLISCSSVRSGAGSGRVSIPFFTHFCSWPDLEGGASPRGCDALQTAELAAGKLHLRMDVVVLAFQVSPLVPLWLLSQSHLTTSHTVVCVLSCLWASRPAVSSNTNRRAWGLGAVRGAHFSDKGPVLWGNSHCRLAASAAKSPPKIEKPLPLLDPLCRKCVLTQGNEVGPCDVTKGHC